MHGVALTLAAFSVIAALLAWSRRLARRRAAALGHLVLAATCAGLTVAVGSLDAATDPYHPVVAGRPVAELRFDAAGAGRHRAMLLNLPDGRVQVVELTGDQWRVTARALEWRDWIARLGVRTAARLERIESGHGDRAVQDYPLAEPGPDGAVPTDLGAWSRLARTPTLDTGWRPVTDGAEYLLRLGDDRIDVEQVPGGPTLAR